MVSLATSLLPGDASSPRTHAPHSPAESPRGQCFEVADHDVQQCDHPATARCICARKNIASVPEFACDNEANHVPAGVIQKVNQKPPAPVQASPPQREQRLSCPPVRLRLD